MTEKEVQKRVVRLLQACGGKVYNLAQGYRPGGKRHATTRQTKGLPDMYVFFPAWRRAIWFEVKRRPDDWPLDGVEPNVRADFYRRCQRAEQGWFEDLCVETGVWYVLGGVEEARELIDRIGETDV